MKEAETDITSIQITLDLTCSVWIYLGYIKSSFWIVKFEKHCTLRVYKIQLCKAGIEMLLQNVTN